MQKSQHYEAQDDTSVAPIPETIWLEMSALAPTPGRLVILRKNDAEEQTVVWKRSRRFISGHWQPYAIWLSHPEKTPIDFEPEAWRPWP